MKVIHLIDGEDETENENFDEVFEAFVAEERCSNSNNGDGFEDELTGSGNNRHSNKILMNELKQVLVGKAEEHRVREEKAMERKMKSQPNGKSFISIFFDYEKYFRFSSLNLRSLS